MVMKKYIFVMLFLLVMLCPYMVKAENIVNIYLFYGDGCPHCAEEEQWLEGIKEKYNNVHVYMYETWYDEDNDALMNQLKEKYEVTRKGVPFTIIGDKHYMGYNASIGSAIESAIRTFSYRSYEDETGVFLGINETSSQGEDLRSEDEVASVEEKVQQEEASQIRTQRLWIPLIILIGCSIVCIGGVLIFYCYYSHKKDKNDHVI